MLFSHSLNTVSPDRRRTLGFLASNLHIGINPKLLLGMIAAVHTYDVNLFCFPGGSLYPVGEFDPQRSTIYNLVDVDRFDGLITAGATVPGGLLKEYPACMIAACNCRYNRFYLLDLIVPGVILDAVCRFSADR